MAFAKTASAETETVVASFYGKKKADGSYQFHGNDMANGIPFNMYDPVNAAHKELAMCTQVKLKNPKNGRKLTVVITDRGPFIKGRDYDLSRAAADHLGFVKAGKASLEVLEIIPPLTEEYIYNQGCDSYLPRG
jgi:rare lipoprotein A